MSPSTVRRLGLFGFAVSLALALAALVFYGLSSWVETSGDWGPRESRAGTVLAFLAYAAVGTLVLSRRPGNRVGWLLLGAGIGLEFWAATVGYAAYAVVARPDAPGGEIAAWLGTFIWVPGVMLTMLLFLLFPDGRLLSRRWRAVVVLVAVGGTLGMISDALTPGTVASLEHIEIENRFGVAGAETVSELAGWLLLPVAALSAVSLVSRYRRSRGEERLQMKWIVAAAVLVATTLIVALLTENASPTVVTAVSWAYIVAIATVPLAIGIAILKHRLYGIDLIIRRTLVYGALSALLAGLYFGIVLALQQVFSSFAGGSDLAIAISTLAVAALFRPVRARIQSLVDRRFYRAKYDAQRTVEAFAATLRNQVDLDALATELSRVAHQTMQPAHVSLWLRPPGERQ